MKNTLIIEEVKRLHEIMGINPKKILLESVGQAWFESLMKDIIEGAARNADGISDDILDEEAYNAIKPWIKNQFNLSNPDENEIKAYLKLINDDLTSGKSLTEIGSGFEWYKLLDDVVKRNESFYTRLIDDMIESGEFEQIADLLVSTDSANKILASGPETNPKIYNSLIDNLNKLKTAIDESSMDENLKKIISDKMGLNRIPVKSSIPDIDEAFSQLARKIKGENIKYDDLVNLYERAVVYPKSFNFENISKRMNEIKAATKPSDLYFGYIPNIEAFVTKGANRFKLYDKLYRVFKGQPNKTVYIICAWVLALTKLCLLQKSIKLAWQLGIKSGINVDVYEAMYGDLTNVIKDLGGCLIAPYGIVSDLLGYIQSVEGLDVKDKEVQDKLKQMLSNDQDNSDYIKFANGLIKDGKATQKDFEDAGLPTDGLNFGGTNVNTYEQTMDDFKKFLTDNKLGVEDAKNDTDDSGYWKANGKDYKYDKTAKTFVEDEG